MNPIIMKKSWKWEPNKAKNSLLNLLIPKKILHRNPNLLPQAATLNKKTIIR